MFFRSRKYSKECRRLVCEICGEHFVLMPIEVSFYLGSAGGLPRRCRQCRRTAPVVEAYFSGPHVTGDVEEHPQDRSLLATG